MAITVWRRPPRGPLADQRTPSVLSIRDRAALVYQITQKRLDPLLPSLMRETGFDMWIISCNEDNPDPIFETMMPYENWNPITQILVFFDRGAAQGVERLNVSRTDTQGLFKNVWDAAAWDTKKKESQWDCLGRIVRERDPKRIGINEGEVEWAAGGLTVVLKKKSSRRSARNTPPASNRPSRWRHCGPRRSSTKRSSSWSGPRPFPMRSSPICSRTKSSPPVTRRPTTSAITIGSESPTSG